MSRVVFQREKFDTFFKEAGELLAQHWTEIAHFTDIPLNIDTNWYRFCEDAGLLRIYTARLNRGPSEPLTLIGYAVFIVNRNPHYHQSLQAVEDVLYVAPEQRKGRVGIDLLKFSEQELRREHVQLIYHHVKDAHPALGKLLAKDGYAIIDHIWAKRLDG